MKKLLIMASLFWPQKNSGGPPISIMNLVQAIKDKFQIYIISNNHEINETAPLPNVNSGWNEFDFGKVYYVNSGEHTAGNILKLIKEIKPDVIYQNSFFSHNDLIPVLKYKKKVDKGVKVIVAPRGEFYPERIRVGGFKKKLYGKLIKLSGLLKDVYFHGTGKDECDGEKSFLGIKDEYLINIQNLSVMPSNANNSIEKKSGELRLVYIARVHPTKNTLGGIKMLKDVGGNVVYDIYGSLENEEYWQQCCEAIKELPSNVSVNYCGTIPHESVSETVSKYHAYYMPTNGENFGHSIVESMLSERPVVISDQTPWTDINGVCGYALPLKDENGFVSAINDLVNMNQDEYNVLCKKAKEYINGKLDTEKIVKQYIEAFGG